MKCPGCDQEKPKIIFDVKNGWLCDTCREAKRPPKVFTLPVEGLSLE